MGFRSCSNFDYQIRTQQGGVITLEKGSALSYSALYKPSRCGEKKSIIPGRHQRKAFVLFGHLAELADAIALFFLVFGLRVPARVIALRYMHSMGGKLK